MNFKLSLKYMVALLALALVSCDPLDDVYDELDATSNTDISADLVITLSDDDYELVEDEPGGANIANYKNFDAPDEPSTFIPIILKKAYGHLGKGSSALVTYNYYDPIKIYHAYSFTVSAQDYTDLGQRFGNFNDEGDIIAAVKFKYPNAVNEDLVTITYQYYDGSTTGTRTSKVAKIEGSWYVSYLPTQEDYRFMGQAYNNFDSRTTGRDRTAKVLDKLYPFADKGDLRTSVFTYTYVPSGGSRVYEDFLVAYEFNGSNWVGIQDVTAKSLQLGHDGTTWVPDNTIKYVLTTADYTAIGAEFAGTPRGDNLSNYGNFSRTGGGSSWTDEQVIEALAFLLNSGGFITTDGQKYLVSISVYNGSSATENWHLIRSNGAWVKVQ